MKFSVARQTLDTSLGKVVSFLPSRLHGVQSILITVDEPDLIITTAIAEAVVRVVANPVDDLELEDGEEVSPFSINAKLLLDLVRRADADSITFDYSKDTNIITVSSGTSEWSLPLSNFAATVPDAGELKATMPANVLAKAFKAVQYAVGEETGRPYLMMVDVKDGRFRATDGTKYHEVSTGNTNLNFSVFYTVVSPLISFLGTYGEAPVQINDTDDYTQFCIDGDILAVSKLTVPFPNFDDVWLRPLRTQTPQILKVERNDLISALERVQLVAEKDRPVVEITLERQSITLKASKKNGAEATTTVPASWAGPLKSVQFNSAALWKMIKSCKDEELEIRFTRETRERKSPMIIEGEGSWCLLNQIRTK